jgi:hypothetical protein
MALVLDGNGTMTVGDGNITGLSVGGLPTGVVTSTNIADATIAQGDLATLVTPIGVGQTWQNVSGSRAINTTYTNTTGRPIVVNAWGDGNVFGDVNIQIFVNSLLVDVAMASEGSSGGGVGNISAIVPSGATYLINFNGGSPSLQGWTELR